MNDAPPPIIQPAAAPDTETTSLAARMLNVFAIPGHVFDEVRLSPPNTSNWLVPALLAGLVFAISIGSIASRPEFIEKNRAAQQAHIERQVKAGKLSQEKAETTLKAMEQLYQAGTLKTFGALMGIVGGFVRVFWWALVLWALARLFLKVRLKFGKSLEAAGLAGMIGMVAVVISTVIQSNLPNLFAKPDAGAGLDVTGPVQVAIIAVNVFHVWQAFVMTLALARLAAVPFFRSALVLFPFWLLWMTATAIIGGGLLNLAG